MNDQIITLENVRSFARNRRKKNSSPLTIFKITRNIIVFKPFGDYLLAKLILEGCLEIGKVKATDFWNLLSEFKKNEDETREILLEEFGERCGVKKEKIEVWVSDWGGVNLTKRRPS